MDNLITIFRCFGFFKGAKYLVVKASTLVLKKIFVHTSRKNQRFAKIIRNLVGITDGMVKSYIYKNHRRVFDRYENVQDLGKVPSQKIIWTAWLQGVNDLPRAIDESFKAMERHAGDYDVRIVTLANLNDYLKVDANVLKRFNNKQISAAHFTDYIRVLLLKNYGGVWLDATQYMTRELPEDIWNYDLLVWNKVVDHTQKNAYVAIPFVEKFNNSFLVGKKHALFYEFASEITHELLFDPILQLDYFSNFKAYAVGVDKIATLGQEWKAMRVINPDGYIIKQFWNQNMSSKVKSAINNSENFFFTIAYKFTWQNESKGELTTEEYLVRNFR